MTATPYDRVRYPGHFHPQASADRLRCMALLHGWPAAPAGACRLLELGCGDGGHLLPQAAHWPHSRFVGIDTAASAVAEGQASARALGLTNVELRVGDIGGDALPEGPFDYIVAHGVLSWVAPAVRQALFDALARLLSPDGVAYVSYCALPGGYLRNVPRDLMRFHTRHLHEPGERIAGAREIVDVVLAAHPLPGDRVRQVYAHEMAGFDGMDHFLLHDLLGEHAEPLYLTDVVDAAAQRGLQYLCEADIRDLSLAHLPPPVQQRLQAIGDRLEREQTLDFIELRRFRQTLLCRTHRAPDLHVTAGRLAPLFLSTRARARDPQADPGQRPAGGPLVFVHPTEGAVRADTPAQQALLTALAGGDPRGEPWPALRQAVATRLQAAAAPAGAPAAARAAATDTAAATALVPFVLSLHARGWLDLHGERFDHALEPGKHPRVSALNRHLAAAGAPVVTARLRTFQLPDDALRPLVGLLDGSRDRDTLLLELQARSTLAHDARAVTAASLQQRLQLFADHGLLQ